ncbi:ricin-type beta-trefoil lectin domain protein [Hahella sp. CR1]|uniref:ricin-type beta-trefoil lectin domain protein n=1 Tax=Hahella sp. CR1 TaxID=2992807 RepID=UPI002441F35E|nr:ricin-type beta-trefoil lectin domain protein [Hahella sp. CR1]MDG9672055.1 ricin-type beta-trefoil lectin domain protein [Hahella sp. CR1]
MLFKWKTPAVLAAVCSAMLSFGFSTGANAGETFYPPFQAKTANDNHRFDELYYVQPHNSFEHGSRLSEWLERGYRTLELDVIDRGDWESWDKGPYVSHSASPGNQNCSAGSDDQLGHCLDDVVSWMNGHPNAMPLVLFVDMKASWDPLNAWYASEVEQLDEFIGNYLNSRLGGRFYQYQDLINRLNPHFQSNYRNTLKNVGWPKVSELKGKLIVVLTGGFIGDVNGRMETALMNRFGAQSTFLCPDIDTADADEFSGAIDSMSAEHSAYFFCGNVKAGDHYQLTANRAAQYKQIMHLWGAAGDFSNTSYESAWLAVAHGVSVISWDLAAPSSTPTWTANSIPLVGQRRGLPGYFKIKPKVRPEYCMDVDKAQYGNGSDLLSWACGTGDNQKFVYTAEGQLRPKGDNRYCVDFNTGSADNGDKMHLWDCDGGSSEKWRITESGAFQNLNNNGSHCMDIPGGTAESSEQWQIWRCSGGDNQKFYLESVSDWPQTSF